MGQADMDSSNEQYGSLEHAIGRSIHMAEWTVSTAEKPFLRPICAGTMICISIVLLEHQTAIC